MIKNLFLIMKNIFEMIKTKLLLDYKNNLLKVH